MITLERTKILLVEDNQADAVYVEEMLPQETFALQHATDLASAQKCMADSGIAVVLLDLSLPDGHGIETCLSMLKLAPRTPILILTGLHDEELALEAVRHGAQDYILKQDLNERSLVKSIRYALGRKLAEDEVYLSVVAARESEARANESAANLKLSLKASLTGVWAEDLLTGKITTDDQVDEIFGIAPGTFGDTRQDFLDRILEEDRGITAEALKKAFEQRVAVQLDYRIRWPDGSIRYITSRGHVIADATGKPLRLTGVCRDITREREETENAKRLALLEQHEDFVATLSHDLKNPLVGADRILKMLIEGSPFGVLKSDQQKAIEMIKQSNDDMLSLIYNLLDVYRFDQGEAPIYFGQVNIKAAAQECISHFAHAAADLGVCIQGVFEGDNHAIQADSIAIKRILNNLVGNSVKFTKSGDSITVSGAPQGELYILRVADTGTGIKQSDMDALFRRFSQGGMGRKYGAGTGLGLYLCRQLAEAHGGSISCESGEGKGTTFTVMLPIEHAEDSKPADSI